MLKKDDFGNLTDDLKKWASKLKNKFDSVPSVYKYFVVSGTGSIVLVAFMFVLYEPMLDDYDESTTDAITAKKNTTEIVKGPSVEVLSSSGTEGKQEASSDVKGNKEKAIKKEKKTLASVKTNTKKPMVDLLSKNSFKNLMSGKKVKNKKNKKYILHKLRVGETLWEVARKHYGSGFYYPVLFEHNPGLRIYNRKKSVTLRVLKNRKKVEKLYGKYVYRQGKTFFYKYKIKKGDTWQKISKLFYGHANNQDIIKYLNKPVKKLIANKRIVLYLN